MLNYFPVWWFIQSPAAESFFFSEPGRMNRASGNVQASVPMNLFATWDIDRSSSNCIPRQVMLHDVFLHQAYAILIDGNYFGHNTSMSRLIKRFAKNSWIARGFAWEYLRSCSGYGPGGSVKRRSKSCSLHSQKKIFAWGVRVFVSDVISGGLLGHLGPLFLALGANREMVVFCWSCIGF